MRTSTETNRPFVVVSGLPGSGKSTLAQRLSPLLGLAIIDKDDILEHLFEAKGRGDKAWRRALSRESDEIFQEQALHRKERYWYLSGICLVCPLTREPLRDGYRGFQVASLTCIATARLKLPQNVASGENDTPAISMLKHPKNKSSQVSEPSHIWDHWK